MQFQAYSDPGHAWVKVKKSLLKDLNIEEKITHFSYSKGEYAYLEEDCDLTTLVNALKEKGINYSFKTNHSNRSSRIRNYYRYTKPSELNK